jgi:hypothetical protein
MTTASHDKPSRLSLHASAYFGRRGFTVAEVEETIRSSAWLPAKNDRLEAAKDFVYDGEWNGRYFAAKRVPAVFVEEENEIVVVTV